MKTQEFFKKWKNDSPKSFEKFIKYLNIRYTDYFYYNKKQTEIEIKLELNNEVCKFEMLTGVIENFFDANKIKIAIMYNFRNKDVLYNWKGSISKQAFTASYHTKTFITKQETQIQSYLKAAEILEKELG